MKVTVDEKKGVLIIEAPLANPPQLSGSGKTLLIVSTRGSAKTDVQVGGKDLIINLNAYVYAGEKKAK